ncbi:hypothetical protein CcI156_18570 [Frankia sp. CcI156]|nr:hypothetical protein CcI156_18570 [Frankia sp. CcI156]
MLPDRDVPVAGQPFARLFGDQALLATGGIDEVRAGHGGAVGERHLTAVGGRGEVGDGHPGGDVDSEVPGVFQQDLVEL